MRPMFLFVLLALLAVAASFSPSYARGVALNKLNVNSFSGINRVGFSGCSGGASAFRLSSDLTVDADDSKKLDTAAAAAAAAADKVKPKDMLAKYGIAYLATSITLALISYALCYCLISNGVDVVSLLERVGLQASGAASNAGTAALAYAVHKAASPIRFPPTVALTPMVARWFGRTRER
mmetsp:Transcript_3753/g.8476  ORF Transcript_3753/g.8476 Transcript_3753/m.8476 type:complete len:180 (+) Transcript_3753:351-890(+)